MKSLVGILVFVLPSFISVVLLRALGHKIGKNVKIGFSLLNCQEIYLANNASIGHLNLFLNDSISLKEGAYIGYLNILKGPFSLKLDETAALGNKNYLTRGRLGITYGESILSLGVLTKMTTGHHIDMTRSISFGNHSILAGIKSQMWTHGYYHAKTGKDRIRIDGEIKIGSNVYIGSSCIFNPGVEVSNAIHIGGGSVISKNLTKNGMHVNQPLRFIENNIEEITKNLKEVEGYKLVEKVYIKDKYSISLND